MIDKCRNGHEIKRDDREYETSRVHVRWCRCGTVRTDSTAEEAERAFQAAFGPQEVTMNHPIRGVINRVSTELGLVTIGGTVYLAMPSTASDAYDWVGREVTARVVGRIVDRIELTPEELEKEVVDGQAGTGECGEAGEGEI